MANEITKQQVKHVATLANLTLTEEELNLFTNQLQGILDFVKEIDEVNTSNVEPTFQTIDGTTNRLREDKVYPSLSQSEALSEAPKSLKGYFVTTNVFLSNKNNQAISIDKRTKRKQIDKLNAILTEVNPEGVISYKDIFLTKGVETTAGSLVLEGYEPQYSASIVQIMEKAGFKTKAKLNCDAWAHGSSGENSAFGPTKNPWNLDYISGGSSSGSAAAVAAGYTKYSMGTDTGGSIRLPASFTGTTALKPTFGAVSRFGIIAMASSLDSPGFFAKSVMEVRALFARGAQADSHDATSQSSARSSWKNKTAKVIGIPREFITNGIDPEVKSAVEQAIEVFKKQGIKVKEVSLPHTKYGIGVYYLVQTTEVSSNLARYDGIRYGHDRRAFGAEAKRRIMLGTFASSTGYSGKFYEKAARVRTLVIEDFKKAFTEVDMILAPVSPTPPFKLGEKTNNPLQMYLSDVLTVTINLAGIPGLALPCGFTKNKLPIGFQLVGPRWSEEMLFNAGEMFQQKTAWHQAKPEGFHGQ